MTDNASSSTASIDAIEIVTWFPTASGSGARVGKEHGTNGRNEPDQAGNSKDYELDGLPATLSSFEYLFQFFLEARLVATCLPCSRLPLNHIPLLIKLALKDGLFEGVFRDLNVSTTKGRGCGRSWELNFRRESC